MKRILIFIIFLCIGIALPIVGVKAYRSSERLMNEGIDVEAKIVSNNGGEIKVEYKDKNGKTVTAKGIINDSDRSVGREFKGKYFPDDPKTVHLPAKKSLIYLVMAMFGGFTLFSWIIVIRGIVNKATGSSVGKNGIVTRAQVLNYNVETNMCTVQFRRGDGLDCVVDVRSEIAYSIGAYINIKYIPKGKSANVIILGY